MTAEQKGSSWQNTVGTHGGEMGGTCLSAQAENTVSVKSHYSHPKRKLTFEFYRNTMDAVRSASKKGETPEEAARALCSKELE